MFPIDAVYLWVDGSEPGFLPECKEHWDEFQGGCFPETAFADHGELRFSLRSLEKYAPWVRHVYIVTNGQVPSWLVENHPKVSVVQQKDIFPSEVQLPVYNSHLIEAFVNRIPGLAEHFLLFNDDFFLGKPVEPSSFFTADGRIKAQHSSAWTGKEQELVNQGAYFQCWEYANDLLNAQVASACRKVPAHHVRAATKQIYAELHEAFTPQIRAMCSHRFRKPTDVPTASFLVSWWALATGKGCMGDSVFRHVSLSNDITENMSETREVFAGDVTLVCINESILYDYRSVWNGVRQVLREVFPQPSSFETDDETTYEYKDDLGRLLWGPKVFTTRKQRSLTFQSS